MTAPRPRLTDRHRWVIPALWLAVALTFWPITNSAPMLAMSPPVHDTYYVVASHPFLLSISAGCLIVAGIYAFLGLVLRLDYRALLAWVHLGATSVGLALISATPYLAVQFIGLPRRFEADPMRTLEVLNLIISIGYGVTAVGAAVFVALIAELALRRRRVTSASR